MKKKKTTTKGFRWTGWITPTNQTSNNTLTVTGGNFVLELVLPNALKITSFTKLKDRLEKYIKSHGGRLPENIRINHRQWDEYIALHPKHPDLHYNPKQHPLSFHGIPLLLHMSTFDGFDTLKNAKR